MTTQRSLFFDDVLVLFLSLFLFLFSFLSFFFFLFSVNSFHPLRLRASPSPPRHFQPSPFSTDTNLPSLQSSLPLSAFLLTRFSSILLILLVSFPLSSSPSHPPSPFHLLYPSSRVSRPSRESVSSFNPLLSRHPLSLSLSKVLSKSFCLRGSIPYVTPQTARHP